MASSIDHPSTGSHASHASSQYWRSCDDCEASVQHDDPETLGDHVADTINVPLLEFYDDHQEDDLQANDKATVDR